MKKIKLLSLMIVAIGGMSAVTSAMAAMPLPIGWYLEANGGFTRTSNQNIGSNASSTSPGAGWNASVGYKFMPYFGTELGYNAYAKSKIKYVGTPVAQDTNKSYYLAAKAILPVVDSGFEFFAKLGVTRITSHLTVTNPTFVSQNGLSINAGTQTATGAYFGVGGDYSFMPNLQLDMQWNRSRGNSRVGNLDLYTLGVTYIFN